ncbi:hypothetical protein BDZ45DRAFT_140497 [Acephala macrosclerotiorum]|nr:hypothetical protein BDZ45DRAFT_140497 [Acephala macrosclerotiorum]
MPQLQRCIRGDGKGDMGYALSRVALATIDIAPRRSRFLLDIFKLINIYFAPYDRLPVYHLFKRPGSEIWRVTSSANSLFLVSTRSTSCAKWGLHKYRIGPTCLRKLEVYSVSTDCNAFNDLKYREKASFLVIASPKTISIFFGSESSASLAIYLADYDTSHFFRKQEREYSVLVFENESHDYRSLDCTLMLFRIDRKRLLVSFHACYWSHLFR